MFGECGEGQKDTAVLGETEIITPISITGNDLIQVHYPGGSGAGGTDSFDAIAELCFRVQGK